MLKFAWNFLKKYMGEFILMVIVIIVSWVASLGVPKVTGEYIDTIVAGKVDIQYTKILIIAFLIIAVAEFISMFLSAYYRNKIANRLMFDVRIYLLSYVRKLPLPFFKENDSSYLGQRISEDSWEVGAFITILIIGAIINIITVVIVYIYFFFVNISIGFKLVLLVPIYLLIYHIFKNPIYRVTMSMREATNKVFSSMNNQLINIKIIKANSWFNIFDREIKEKSDDAFKTILKYNIVNFIFYSTDIVINRLATIILIVFSGALVLDGKMTVGEFTIINSYFVIAMKSVTELLEFGSSYQRAKVSFDRINEILKNEKENNGQVIIPFINLIKIENLTFTYGEERKIFDKFNCQFKKGKIYCIIGENGRGKSTLTNLLLGLYLEYEGKITYDNEDIKNLNLYSIRENLVGYVEQEPLLLQTFLKDNISMNVNNIDNGKFAYWSEKLGIDEMADRMENGFNTIISENGSNLSGGEKQRVILCRTLLKNVDLVIMDEPTAALDKKSRENLYTILSEIKKDKIIILITHDEGFMEIADEIIKL